MMTGPTLVYARSERERGLWIRAFCRIIDINGGAKEPFTTGYSRTFTLLMER